MILYRERWHYLEVKKLSALLRGVTFNYRDDFYCLNCLHYFTKENKRVCENIFVTL